MKFFIQTTSLDEKGETVTTEKEVVSLVTAQTEKKAGEKIHVCRHQEGLPCSLE